MRHLIGLLLWCVVTLAAHADITRIHHNLGIKLDPATRELHAADTVNITGNGAAIFALGREFSLEHITLDNHALRSEQLLIADTVDGLSRWRIPLGEKVEQHVLTLRYQGTLSPLKATTDERNVLQRLPAMADSSGSYLPASSAWYPQFESIPFTYTLTLDLPDPQRGIVPGKLIEEKQQHGRTLARFEFNHPAEGIELMAGPYRIEERVENNVRLRTYFHPQIAHLVQDYLGSISDYIELYSRWIGPYPFSEFSIVSSPLPTGFGMPALTYLGIDVLRLPFIRFGSLGHEILHNWWGNGVYVDWQRGNWSEGLTTFMADYTYKERAGADAARAMRLSWLRDFAAIPEGQDIPLRDFTSRSHSASQTIGYHKAAFLFLMLRDKIGAQAFDAGLQAFWKEQQFKTASWTDLQHAFEQSSGKNLNDFFHQWLSRRGAPLLGVEDIQSTVQGEKYQVSFTLTQPTPAYNLRVPVVIKTAQGDKEHLIEFMQIKTRYTLDVDAAPQSLTLDPDLRLFRTLDAVELPSILRQIINDPATQTFILTPESAFRKTAAVIAEKLLDHPPQFSAELNAAASLLVIGPHDAVDRFLAERKLPARPENLRGKGTAQVWTVRQNNGKVTVLVSVSDAHALEALLRPLPHYGSESFLAFEHSKVIERGVWPAQSPEWPLK
ncbi:MAG: M1 family aminopeptidase [Gammaproteobacteria bacterium]|nr:M1 family aminopeptidase [Gammaproteobacteria bacterium]